MPWLYGSPIQVEPRSRKGEPMPNMNQPQPIFKTQKAEPFGAHFTKKLESVNNKLVCALSAATTCTDDHIANAN
jgi:hypothetical protein